MISTVKVSILTHTVAPRYTNLADCLCTWPAASVTKVTLSIPFVIGHTVSVLASETANPNEAYIATAPASIFARLCLDLETMPASSAYSIPHIGCGSATVPWGLCRPFFGLSRFFLPPPISILTFYHGAHHTLHHICIGTKPLMRVAVERFIANADVVKDMVCSMVRGEKGVGNTRETRQETAT